MEIADVVQAESGPNELQNLALSSLSKVAFCSNFYEDQISFLSEIFAKLWTNALSRNVENSFKKFLDPYQEADDCRNLFCSFLFTDTSFSGEIFTMNRSMNSF